MKKTLLISIGLLLHLAAISQCTVEDCIMPYNPDCTPWCYSVKNMINSGTSSELQLIGGFTPEMAEQIIMARESKANGAKELEVETFYASLNEAKKKSFSKSITQINTKQIDFFKQPEKDRIKLNKELNKLDGKEIPKTMGPEMKGIK